jgi:hypothetical protein
MKNIYIVLCYQTYSERNLTNLYVTAENGEQAYSIALDYMKKENEQMGFEYYSEFPAWAGTRVGKLKTINEHIEVGNE